MSKSNTGFRIFHKIKKEYLTDLDTYFLAMNGDVYRLAANLESSSLMWNITDEVIVEWYADRRDKNKVRLYEGDRVEIDDFGLLCKFEQPKIDTVKLNIREGLWLEHESFLEEGQGLVESLFTVKIGTIHDETIRAFHIAEKKMYQVIVMDWMLERVECTNLDTTGCYRFLFKEVHLLQYTNLRDHGGKGPKLYQGDVVKVIISTVPDQYEKVNGVIKQESGSWIIADNEGQLIMSLNNYANYNFCGGKIGNIHEDPGLMEK